MSDDIVILSGARTAIGTFGGALAGTPATTLGATVAREALARAGVDGAQIGHVVFGNVINTEPRDMYLSRVAAMEAGVPDAVPAMNVNRLCGSGVQAIVSAVAVADAGGCGFRAGGRRREHEPRALHPARRALGAEDGRCGIARHVAGHAELPLRHRAHGRHGGERRGASMG